MRWIVTGPYAADRESVDADRLEMAKNGDAQFFNGETLIAVFKKWQSIVGGEATESGAQAGDEIIDAEILEADDDQ